jgi:3-deoxy-manno-octulosonate cytidylyltransferase (CMP-KDO synthetase)
VPVAVASDETSRAVLPRSIVVIPARYASSRFPGKPLALIAGRTMIEHVYRRAAESRIVDGVIVATDDERVVEAVHAFGGDVRMTRGDHGTGTERLAEVAHSLECDLVINVQGDEPLMDPRMIDEAVAPFAGDAALPMSTPCTSRALPFPDAVTQVLPAPRAPSSTSASTSIAASSC